MDNEKPPPQTTIEPYVCDDCRWRAGWLHRPGEYWCGATIGRFIADRLDRPTWCPPGRAVIRELHYER